MKIVIKILVSFLMVLSQLNVLAQKEEINIDSLYNEIDLLTGESWYLERTERGFKLTFCRSCAEKYNLYLDSSDSFHRQLSRNDFFLEHQFDSISYFPTSSHIPMPYNWSENDKTDYFTKLYIPQTVLQFEVKIEQKWSDQEYDLVLRKNNELKEAILKEQIFKSNLNIFSDYRFWLPSGEWKTRTEEFNYYFERLPYSSLTIINKSIFIEHNKPSFFCEPMLVDKNDDTFFDKNQNNLENERRRTLKIIALTLGVHDYRVVN